MFPCQLLNSGSPSPYLFLLSAKPNSPQLFCHWGLSRLLPLILISVIKFSFLLTSEQSPILESWLPHLLILPFLSTPLTRPCASPQLVFPGLFPSKVCDCFPQLLFIPHLSIRLTSPASGLTMLKNLRSLLIIAKSRWFVINSTQSFSIQSFLPSESCVHVSLHSSLSLSLPTQAQSSQCLGSLVLLQLWLLRRPLWSTPVRFVCLLHTYQREASVHIAGLLNTFPFPQECLGGQSLCH